MIDRNALPVWATLLAVLAVLAYPWLAPSLGVHRLAGLPATLWYLMGAWAGLIGLAMAMPRGK